MLEFQIQELLMHQYLIILSIKKIQVKVIFTHMNEQEINTHPFLLFYPAYNLSYLNEIILIKE